MTPREFGLALAAASEPLTDEQVEKAARLIATLQPEEMAA